MSYTTKIKEVTEVFIKISDDSSFKSYQEYKDALVKIIDAMSPGELVDFAVTVRKRF